MEGEKNKKITDKEEEEIPVLSSNMDNPSDDSVANSTANAIVNDENNGEEEKKKLPDGFFEVESVRRKKVHKGQVQYLIKWQGYPESANTWEPVENLEACLALVDAFNERSSQSRKPKTKHHNHAQPKKKEQKHSAAAGCPIAVPFADCEEEEPDADMSETSEQSIRNGPEDNSSEMQKSKGAKKRKSGAVKRFIKESVLSDLNNKQNETTGIDIDTILRVESLKDENKTENWDKEYTITEIIESVSYSTSATDNFQEVLVKFKAMRSDGKKVVVDNKYLKANNPLLLINFYEQKLRHNLSI